MKWPQQANATPPVQLKQYEVLRGVAGGRIEILPVSGQEKQMCIHMGTLFKLNIVFQAPDKDGLVAATLALTLADPGKPLTFQ